MNCVGQRNYVHFVSMLLSLWILLSYGTYLAYTILDNALQDSTLRRVDGMSGRSHWSKGKTWSQYASLWAWALAQDIRIGSVGLLALMCAPLAAGLFLYHVYLIWAGMTTNETSKWADWKEDIADGLVYGTELTSEELSALRKDPEVEPEIYWPKTSNQRLAQSHNGQPPEPRSGEQSPASDTQGSGFRKIDGLHEVENIYDLGFWDNLKDVLRNM